MIITTVVTTANILGEGFAHCWLPVAHPPRRVPSQAQAAKSGQVVLIDETNPAQSTYTAALSRLHHRSLPRAAVLYWSSRETSGTLRECQGRRSSETAPRCGEQSGLGARVKCHGAPQAENMTGKRKPQWLRFQPNPPVLLGGLGRAFPSFHFHCQGR